MYSRRYSKLDINFSFDPIFFLILFFCFVYRLSFLISSNFNFDSDEAIVGLMAKHINETGSYPVFYYGQHYMGSLEAILISFIYKIFGVSPVGLKIIPLIFSVISIYPLYRIGEIIAGKNAGRISALLYSFPSQMFLLWSLKARGGFIEIFFISALVLLLTIKYLIDEKPKILRLILIALLSGLGWWTNNQIIYVISACGIFILPKLFKNGFFSGIKSFFIGGFSFFLGSLPFWIYNIKNNWVTFEKFTSTNNINSNFHGLYINSLPILFGAKRNWTEDTLFRFSAHVFYLILFLSIINIFINFYKLDKRKTAVFLLMIFFIFTCFIFSYSSFGSLNLEPRYLLPLYIFWCTILGVGISFINFSKVRQFLIFFILAINIYSAFPGSFYLPGEPFVYKKDRVSKDHKDLITWLSANNINHIKTNYWIGYRIALETNESIKFNLFGTPRDLRIKEYQIKDQNLPLVLTINQAKEIKKAFDFTGITYKQVFKSNYIIIYDIQHPAALNEFDPKIHKINSNFGINTVNFLHDNNIDTRYASESPQNPEMFVEINFIKPVKINAFKYEFGDFKKDYPRNFKVVITDIGDRQIEICNESQYKFLTYLISENYDLIFNLPNIFIKNIKLYQTGKDSIHDWSIPELRFYKK